MALETSRLNFQLQNFSRVLTQNAVSLEEYTKNTGLMLLSLGSQIKPLHSFEKRHECQMDAPTSGESSPCLSDSEKDSRPSMPTLQEISDLLTDELALEVDAPAERFKGFYGKDLTLIFEDFDPGFPKNRFYRYLKETKYSNYISDKIVHAREMKFICFRGNNSLLVDFHVKKSDLLGGFMETFHACLKKETRRPIKMHRVIDDRRNKDLWFGVIIRNLPPKVTQKELINQCQKEVTGQISVGTLIKVKERHCCIIRCDYLEDVEIICRKLNNFQLKDPSTNMKYVIKAHLHPQSALRHLIKDKSPFAEFVQSTDKNASDKASGKSGKTGIGELLEIFNRSKKTSEKQKPPPPPPISAKRNETMEEERAPPPPVNGMENLLKRIYSAPEEIQPRPETFTMETQETSIFTKMIKQTTTESTTQEADLKASQEGSINGKDALKEGKENQLKMEEEGKNSDINVKNENIEKKNFEGNGPKLFIKKEYEGKRHDRRNERSSSRHDKRSSSRRRRQNYDKSDYSSRRESKYDSRDYDRQKKNRSHKESRERKRKSKSKSKSRSRSRSKNRVKSRKSDYDSKRSRKPDYEKSPKRSSSPNKKKYNTKARSRSGSKSRSRSAHREKYKEDKGKSKAVTLYEYEHKDNRSDGTRSPSPSKKNKKRRDSHSRSLERSKRRHDNKSPHKSYYNHSRDKFHDYHKDSYSRKDNRDTKNYNDYKSSHRKSSYYSRNDYRDQDDKQRRRNRDNDKQQRDKEKSRSRNSKSPNKRSPSRSKSSRGSRERRTRESIERKSQQNAHDFDTSSKTATANVEADKEAPQEKN